MTETRRAVDARFMAAAIRLAERHLGRTGTNPSVGTLIVRDDGAAPVIVGRGVTALGGRPHSEPVALAQAGELASGATAYVTLEPCAHHGRTPPCTDALIAAGVARVVFAASDPDSRVDGRGAAALRAAGIRVEAAVMGAEARRSLGGYLARSTKKRPEVTLKIAVSADGMIGRRGAGQVVITGPIANRQTHLLRSRSDAILVGAATVAEDDPALKCRLAGLADRSPRRIVLDAALATPLTARLVETARDVPTAFATLDPTSVRADALRKRGCAILAAEAEPGTGRISLRKLMADVATSGSATVLVEAGARLAEAFLAVDLIDRLILIEGATTIGPDGIASPFDPARPPPGFHLPRDYRFGPDRWREFERVAKAEPQP